MSLLQLFRVSAERRLMRRTLERWLGDPELERRVQHVIDLDPSALGLEAGAGDPRGLPGNPEFRKSGWSDHMLLRYLLALDAARAKSVLDTCSGLGWGAHLVAAVAAEVVAIDLEPRAVSFSRNTWTEDNLRFVQGSVLELPFDAERFDVVLCMEAIEHFSPADGRRYLAELARVCRAGGMLFGSSGFPEKRAEADAICRENPHHLYVYTRREMDALLRETFGVPVRLTRHYFAAKRA